jgi:hypothetical protein
MASEDSVVGLQELEPEECMALETVPVGRVGVTIDALPRYSR